MIETAQQSALVLKSDQKDESNREHVRPEKFWEDSDVHTYNLSWGCEYYPLDTVRLKRNNLDL